LLYMTPAHARDILTWEECVSEAKKNHPDLLSAAEKVRQAKEDKAIETSSLLPQINSSVSGKSAKSSAGAATDTYSYGLTGEQLVFDGFKTIHNISGASETLKAEEYNYAVTSSNIRLNLRSAFTGLLKARELLSLTKEISKRRNENLELVRLRYEAGREHKGSLLTAEADLAGAEYEVKQAERNIMLSRRELSAEMGLAKPGPVNVAGDFIVPPHYGVKPDIDRLADSTPFLRELMARKEASRHDLKSQKADFLPRIYLNGAVGKTREEWPPGDDTWSFGMTVSLPIFEGGSRISEVKKADSKLRQAEADERSGRDSVLVTLETAWKNLRDAIENVSVRKKFLEATEERARITQAQYETGLISFDNWIIIEDNLVNAKKAFLNAEANMLIAEAYWIQAMGGTLEYD
ncbi:MAG TPA: TolC family protein, partial [Candidatus Omnitrophica bacterium]|nr:TolC family protein [Candidatus Omnitrophota bacterium]